MCFEFRTADPYGDSLERDHAIRSAMNEHAPDGWRIESIDAKLQSDGHNCGPWSHAALELFAQYFKAGDFSAGFTKVLKGTPGLQPLNGLRATSRACAAAEAVNTVYVQNVRSEMRQALRASHKRGKMPFLPLGDAEPYFADVLARVQAHGHSLEDGINVDTLPATSSCE